MDKLQLGSIVKNERREAKQRVASSGHKTHSKDYEKRKRKLTKGMS